MNKMNNYQATISEAEYQKTYQFLSTDILNVKITYPVVQLISNEIAENRINRYYNFSVYQFKHYTSNEFKANALDSYLYARKNKFPFRENQAVMNYTVTFNEACILSTYFDQYQYSGGAHGNTIRTSVNWDLNTGKIITLDDIFQNQTYYGEYLINAIIELAEAQAKTNQFIFFDNYRDTIFQNFNPKNFYFTPSGITIFYQQYEIGPYSSGIIEFQLEYDSYHNCFES